MKHSYVKSNYTLNTSNIDKIKNIQNEEQLTLFWVQENNLNEIHDMLTITQCPIENIEKKFNLLQISNEIFSIWDSEVEMIGGHDALKYNDLTVEQIEEDDRWRSIFFNENYEISFDVATSVFPEELNNSENLNGSVLDILPDIETSADKFHEETQTWLAYYLKNWWILPYSWFLMLVEFFKSCTINAYVINGNRGYYETFTISEIFDNIRMPYLLFGMMGVAANGCHRLWNYIVTRQQMRFPMRPNYVSEYNRLLCSFFARKTFKTYIRPHIKGFLIRRKYNASDKHVKDMVKKIAREFFKWLR